MSKMDGLASRTPADIERKYNFGKSFSEVWGIANDAQTFAKEAKEVAERVEYNVMNIDIVSKLNVSAGTITLKSEGLTIESDGFSLSADEGIKAIKGNIGLWDISENGISKITDNYFVKIDAPETADDDVITVARIENGVVTAMPFSVKADGKIITTYGKIGDFDLSGGKLSAAWIDETENVSYETVISANQIKTESISDTQTRKAIFANGRIDFYLDGEEIVYPSFANFYFGGHHYSLYVDFANDNILKAKDWGAIT